MDSKREREMGEKILRAETVEMGDDRKIEAILDTSFNGNF